MAALDLARRPHSGTTALLEFMQRYRPRARHAEVERLALTDGWARTGELAPHIAAYVELRPNPSAALSRPAWFVRRS